MVTGLHNVKNSFPAAFKDEPAVVMPQFNVHERVWLVQRYYMLFGSVKQGKPALVSVQRAFEHTFEKKAPAKKNLIKIVDKFVETGNVMNHNKGHSGRPRTARTNDNTGKILEKVLQSPKKSVRRLSSELDLSIRSVHTMLKDINAFSYKIQVFQKLNPNDTLVRSQFCARTLATQYDDPSFLSRWWWSDECHIQLNGQVNKQNLRFWGWQKPDECETKPLHSERITVWCAVSQHAIIGPYFINGILNAAMYREQIMDRFVGDLSTVCDTLNLNYDEQIFQQDGAPVHVGKGNLEYIESLFPGRVISRNSEYAYPPRSPDLTPPDAFLWGIIKEKAFNPPPRTLQELSDNVTRIITEIHADTLYKMVRNIERRLEICLERNGGHVEHVIS